MGLLPWKDHNLIFLYISQNLLNRQNIDFYPFCKINIFLRISQSFP